MNLYVSNISQTVKADDLRSLFQGIGNVTSVKIIGDKYTGESRGFGFVDMSNDNDALEAIKKLTNAELGGKRLVVSKARERTSGY
jgi:RNA recognition motif-containing protein